MRARDIAQQLDWERSRLSHLLKRMEASGLVSGSVSHRPRGFNISMTTAGWDAIGRLRPAT